MVDSSIPAFRRRPTTTSSSRDMARSTRSLQRWPEQAVHRGKAARKTWLIGKRDVRAPNGLANATSPPAQHVISMRHRVSSGVLETSTKDHPLASHLRHTPIFSAAATDATAAPELKSNPLTWHGELLTR